MMCTPATPGMVESSSISSTQMRWPSAAGIGGLLHPLDDRVGNDGAEQVLAHPVRRLGRAQRRDADQQIEAARDAGVGQPLRRSGARSPASMQNWVCANCAPAAILAGELVRLPVGRRIDRRVGRADEERALAPATLRAGRQLVLSRMLARRLRSASPNRDRTPPWRRAGRRRSACRRSSISRLWMPSAAAPIRSLCSAMRLRSRQASWRIGSMPALRQDRGGDGALRCARAPAPSVTLTASASPCQRQRLRQQVAGIAGHRRHDLGGDDELPGPQSLFQARGRRSLGHRWASAERRGRGAASGQMPLIADRFAPVKSGATAAAASWTGTGFLDSRLDPPLQAVTPRSRRSRGRRGGRARRTGAGGKSVVNERRQRDPVGIPRLSSSRTATRSCRRRRSCRATTRR